ncbi:MAG: hypothetical protein HYV37_02820 [Candidatus Levyibacteriota bacterium]|nr:MAG: hypothetical protein HYV37_02820 [Candidatus Levybacteria bacterium]
MRARQELETRLNLEKRDNSVEQYLNEIGRYSLLSREEEIGFGKKADRGRYASALLGYISGEEIVCKGSSPVALDLLNEFRLWPYAELVFEDKKPEQEMKLDRRLARSVIGIKVLDEDAFVDRLRDLQGCLQEYVLDGVEAEKEMINGNLRLVVSVAKKYIGRGVSFLDMIQDGNEGLIKGSKKISMGKRV